MIKCIFYSGFYCFESTPKHFLRLLNPCILAPLVSFYGLSKNFGTDRLINRGISLVNFLYLLHPIFYEG